MKFSTTDLHHLFTSATSAPPPEPPALSSAPGPSETGASAEASLAKSPRATQSADYAPASKSTRSSRNPFTPAHRELSAALPALWAKAKSQGLSRSEERKKLRALIGWLASKKGLQAQELAPMAYRHKGELIDGKIDLLLKKDELPVLAIEADWAPQEASLAKLKAAHEKGIPVMWIVGAPANNPIQAKQPRQFAVSVLGAHAQAWLTVYHIERGWL